MNLTLDDPRWERQQTWMRSTVVWCSNTAGEYLGYTHENAATEIGPDGQLRANER